MKLNQSQVDLLSELETSPETGLSSDVARRRRDGIEGVNTVDPPLKCPAWVCCLLPCIKHVPSMRLFREIMPEEAEVLRESEWVCYDATSLVRGDIVRVRAGDRVPADCVLLSVGGEMTVDLTPIVGADDGCSKPRTITAADFREGCDGERLRLLYGGLVLDGTGMAVVTAIGQATVLASRLRTGRWPPRGNANANGSVGGPDDGEVEVSLLPTKGQSA